MLYGAMGRLFPGRPVLATTSGNRSPWETAHRAL
jgi:hypothetical protein